MLLAGAGLAATPSPSSTTFEFANLWSSPTTWGGAPPPQAGDSVFLPAGITVVLDVSPPPLVALLLDGTLKFCNLAPQLALTASYILVRVGGRLGCW